MEPQTRRPLLFPDSPTVEQWAGMTEEERRRWLASIPQDPPPIGVSPPEGLAHDLPTRQAMEALDQFFRKRGRHIFLASDLGVIYPGEPSFAPDLIAVLDAERKPDDDRAAWVVATEGRGIDVALEVHVSGDRKKDAVENVEIYARLGIKEYFFFDRSRWKLFGWRLPRVGATTYHPILPQEGRLHSDVLELDLGLVDGRLRFMFGTAELPAAAELIERLDKLLEGFNDRLAAEVRVREEVELRLEASEKARVESEKRNAELLAENERLRQGKP